MTYLLMAIVGALVGWFTVQYMGLKVSMLQGVALGIVGGLIGGAIATLLSFAAVILFKLLLTLGGAYMLIYIMQRYLNKASK